MSIWVLMTCVVIALSIGFALIYNVRLGDLQPDAEGRRAYQERKAEEYVDYGANPDEARLHARVFGYVYRLQENLDHAVQRFTMAYVLLSFAILFTLICLILFLKELRGRAEDVGPRKLTKPISGADEPS